MTSAGKPRPKSRPAVSRTDQQSTYVSLSVTKALMRDGLAWHRNRLAASDMVTLDEAAKLARTTVTNINRWIDKGRCIRTQCGGTRLSIATLAVDARLELTRVSSG